MLVCCVNEQEKYTQHLRERKKGKVYTKTSQLLLDIINKVWRQQSYSASLFRQGKSTALQHALWLGDFGGLYYVSNLDTRDVGGNFWWWVEIS